MRCGEIRPLISAYYDGEATPEERRTVERHLARCEDCRSLLAEYRVIGGDLRALSVPMPPAGLRRDVWRAIEVRQGGSRIARVSPSGGKALAFPQTQQTRRETPRFAGTSVFTRASNGWAKALPVALLAGAFAVILSFVLIRNSTPAQAARLEETGEVFNYSQPVHIVFSKSVLAGDATANTTVEELAGGNAQPTICVGCRKNYLSSSNSMEVWPKDTWKPGSSYKITVDAPSIRQPVGNEPLGSAPIVLTFTAAAHTPTATRTATVTSTPTRTSTPTPTSVPPTSTPKPTQVIINAGKMPLPANSPVAIAPTATSSVEQTPHTATATARASATPPQNTPAPLDTAVVATSTTVPPTPTAQARPTGTSEAAKTPQPTQTATATATSTARPVVVTATSTRSAATATASATATLKRTPTATSTPQPRPTGGNASPTATPGGCLLTPVRGFGKVWTGNASVRGRIGCPTITEETVVPAAEQHFQGGYMFWRGDTRTIYVFVGDTDVSGAWYEFKDSWVEGEPIPPVGGTPTAGSYVPVRGFGKVWANSEGIRQALGYAVDQETNIDAVWQPFERGYALWTADRVIRFLYDDGRWERYNDTFQSDEKTTPAAGS